MNNKKIFLGTILFFIVVFIFFGLNLKNDNAKEEMDIDDTVSINNLDKINNPNQEEQEMKVLVIEINPILNTISNKPRVSEYFKQDKERALQEVINDLEDGSHNYLKIITTREYLNEFPTYKKEITLANGKKGYRYDEATFLKRDKYSRNWYNYIYNEYANPSEYSFDYDYIIDKYDLINKRNNHEFDAVWLLTIDPASTYETMMVGRSAFYFNSNAYIADCDNFQLNNISISRRDSNIHAFSHGYEGLMRAVFNRYEESFLDYSKKNSYPYYYVDYNSYDKNKVTIENEKDFNNLNYWEKFVLNTYTNTGNYASVGNVHFPFNGEKDYDYSNKKKVLSNWEEWNHYPNVKWNFKSSDNSVWINHHINKLLTDKDEKDPDRLYIRFWLYMMPHIPGYTKDGYINNWWKYYYSLDFVERLIDDKNENITVKLNNPVRINLRKIFHSGKEEMVTKIPKGDNIIIDNRNIVDYRDGYLYGINVGEAFITLNYDGHSYNYNIKVKK